MSRSLTLAAELWGKNIPIEVSKLALLICATRWLREVKAEAWYEGLHAGSIDANAPNPYREAESP